MISNKESTLEKKIKNAKKISEVLFIPGSILNLAKKTAFEENYSSLKKGITCAGVVSFYDFPRMVGYLYLASEIGNTILGM
jgi:hypothetical protein